LRTANSGAVLSTFKCFVHLTERFPDLQPQIYARTKPPMLTLVTGGHSEIQYTILKHLEIILKQPAARGVFDDEYRQFFVRYNEAPYVKHLKVDVLPYISNDTNAREIATELGEYVTDVDSELSKHAIAAISQISMRVPSVAVDMAQTLIDLVDLDMPYVRTEAVKNLANLIRVYPDAKAYVLPSLSRCFRRVEDADARAALIWILGEHGEHVIEAPYMLEPIIDNYEEEQSAAVKLQVMTAALKLFFKRPPEMQAMLGRLLSYAINDTGNQDVHDRALLYYRLLISDVTVAASLFKGQGLQGITGTGGKVFAEYRDHERLNQVFAEFNTLAVIYGMPSVQFIAEEFQFVSSVPIVFLLVGLFCDVGPDVFVCVV
jgi:AP-4 complex subunit beta-1